MKNSLAYAAMVAACLTLSACGGDNAAVAPNSTNTGPLGGGDPFVPPPPPPALQGQIKVLSNRADLISGGDALVEVALADPSKLSDVRVRANNIDVTDSFTLTEEGRLIGLLQGLKLGTNTLLVTQTDGAAMRSEIINHPLGGPVFSGPQVQPWTCTNNALDAQCNQAPEFSFKYVPADKLGNLLENSELSFENQRLADALLPYDPQNPPADEEIAQTTTENGTTLPFIIRIERGVQNRDRYQVMSLFQPEMDWTAINPQPQWNRKLLIHHGGNVGVSYGPGNPPNGDLSGTAPDGAEFALGDSILAGLGRGFVTLSTALANLGHNVNLVTSAESLVMAKEHIIENYGELQYTIGTGCSGGAIAQQHVANAYPGIYQGIIVQCSYPDVWTTATQFGEYRLLNLYFGNEYPVEETENLQNINDFETFQSIGGEFVASVSETAMNLNQDFIPFAQWSLLYGHLPVNPVVSDLAFFPSVYPTQDNCSGLRGAALQYDAEDRPDGLRCGLIDFMKTQFGVRTPDVWSPNEQAIKRGFTGVPLDNVGVQYGLRAFEQGLITESQFLAVNSEIGGFTVDIVQQPERFVADPEALTNIYRTGGVNTAENLSNIPIIDLRGVDPGIAHDAFHSWQVRARLDATQGHHDNQVIWFGQIPLAGDSTYATEALLVMDRWLTQIAQDESDTALSEKVLANKPTAARDRCLSAQSLYSEDGPFVPFSGSLFYPDPYVQGTDSTQIPQPPAESGMIFDQVANQFCGLDLSAFDPSGESGQVTDPFSELQQTIVQTRFGTPRTVAGDDIRTLTNKCQLKPVAAADYEGFPILNMDTFIASMNDIFKQGVCDFDKPGVGVVPTVTWLQYGNATEAVIGGEPLPAVPAGSRTGWAAPAFELDR